MKVSNLSIQEIRRQFLHQQQPVTAQFLNKLGRDPRQGVRKLREILKKRYEQERAERLRLQNMLNFERVLWSSGVRAVAGVDEVGVGPLAGPVGCISEAPCTGYWVTEQFRTPRLLHQGIPNPRRSGD